MRGVRAAAVGGDVQARGAESDDAGVGGGGVVGGWGGGCSVTGQRNHRQVFNG